MPPCMRPFWSYFSLSVSVVKATIVRRFSHFCSNLLPLSKYLRWMCGGSDTKQIVRKCDIKMDDFKGGGSKRLLKEAYAPPVDWLRKMLSSRLRLRSRLSYGENVNGELLFLPPRRLILRLCTSTFVRILIAHGASTCGDGVSVRRARCSD